MTSLANDEAFDQIYKGIASLFARPESYAFREPVDWKGLNLLDYPDIVKTDVSINKRIVK